MNERGSERYIIERVREKGVEEDTRKGRCRKKINWDKRRGQAADLIGVRMGA